MSNPTIEALEQRLRELEHEGRLKDEEIRRLSGAMEVDTPGLCADLTAGSREMLDEARARELLKDLFAADAATLASYTSIKFGTKSFGAESCVVAAEAIRKLPNLVVADLADIIAGRPEAEALEVLKTICGALPADKVRVLDLSDNALGEKGVRALEPVFKRLTNMQEVSFCNNGLSELSVQLLAEYLPPQNLTRLTFDNNMSGDGGAAAISSFIPTCPNLSNFRMSASRVRAEGGCKVIDSLSGAAGLTHLDLSDSMFGAEGADRLVATLRSLPNLVYLSLKDCGLEEDGVNLMLETLGEDGCCPKLEYLDLSISEITPELAAVLADSLDHMHALKHLILEENELESDGAMTVLRALARVGQKLETLNLKTNQIGRNGAVMAAKYAVASPSLRVLELDDNQISEGGVEEVQTLLESVGKASVLGSLEENQDDMDEDEPEEDANEEDDLVAMFNKVSV